MKRTTTITANGTYLVANVLKGGDHHYLATIFAQGTWGSGTIAWKVSFDGGTTLMDLKDTSGVSVSMTANDNVNVYLGHSTTYPIKIYAVLSGATNPSLLVGVFDNCGG